VVVLGVVQYQDKTLARGAVFEQAHQKTPEGFAIEYRLEGSDQFPGANIGRAEARHGFARRRVQQDGIFVLWRYPHATPCAVLLEVAFIGTP